MNETAKRTMQRVRTYIKTATKNDLDYWLEIIQKEIDINESCNCRTDETEKDLKALYNTKYRIKKRMEVTK